MRLATKIVSGGHERVSRAHDEKGHCALRVTDVPDAFVSGITHLRRLAFGIYPSQPWYTYPAIRALDHILQPEFRVFEFGGGLSTQYYERRCAEVHTVEDNQEWFARIKKRTSKAMVYYLTGQLYVDKINEFPEGYFDLIAVDGSNRLACFLAANARLRRGGYLVLDDTDKEQTMTGPISTLDAMICASTEFDTVRCTGWIPGSFWVKETTICRKL